MLSLTDPCVKDRECLQDWLPGPEDNDPASLMLIGRDEDGKQLLTSLP
ncbi:MAG: hypothetical protein R3E89_07170 [Thiolinea sp.]